MARPRSVMTPDAIAAILRAVMLGVWPDRAAQMHGVSPSTMRNHRRRDPAFATALEKAEAEAESSIHGKILRHMDKQWTAAAWLLERRWPERWAKREPSQADAVAADARRLLTLVTQMRAATHLADPEPPVGASAAQSVEAQP